MAYRALGRVDQAVAVMAIAYKIYMETFDPSHPDRILFATNYALAVEGTDECYVEARTPLRQASREALKRVKNYRDFGVDAKREMTEFKPIFSASVSVAWRLQE